MLAAAGGLIVGGILAFIITHYTVPDASRNMDSPVIAKSGDVVQVAASPFPPTMGDGPDAAGSASRDLSNPPGSPCCPNKWTRSDGRCYFISREAKNWESSLEFCQSEGGTLLPVDDETQQEVKTLHDVAGDYWVGLIKDGDSGKWRQLNGSVWTRPIEYDDPQRKCGFVHSGKYAALDCTTARRWICVMSLQWDQ